MFDYFRNCSGNPHHVCCEDRLAKSMYDHCQSDDLDLHPRSQVRLKLDYSLTCNISDNINAITFKLGMTVDLYTTSHPKEIHILYNLLLRSDKQSRL